MKITNVINVYTDDAPTDKEAYATKTGLYNLWGALWKKKIGWGTISLTTAAAKTTRIRLLLAQIVALTPMEFAASSSYSGQSLRGLPYSDQKSIIEEAIYYINRAVVCGYTPPQVTTFIPALFNDIDDTTKQVVADLGISKILDEDAFSHAPILLSDRAAFDAGMSYDEYKALLFAAVDSGDDLVVMWDTDISGVKPPEWYNGSWYNTAVKFFEYAKTKGAVFVPAREL